MKLSELPNIEGELEKKLNLVGIRDPNELIRIGSIDALKKINDIHDSGCLNMLHALEGAIQGVRWHNLPADVKKRLKSRLFEVDGK